MEVAHQEIVVTEAVATATTLGDLETVVAEGLEEAMGHRNIEMVYSLRSSSDAKAYC